MNEKIVVRLENIDKSFGGVRALKNVSLNLHEGEVLAIIGENGAGKSTLMNILSGTHSPNNGRVIFQGTDISGNGIRERQRLGIAMIHQEIVDFPNLSVARNIFAGIEPRGKGGLVDGRKLLSDAKEFVRDLGTSLDAEAIVGKLSASKRQLTMIAKALAYDASVLIMDEPNSALTDEESVNLFKIIRMLQERGIAIVYISHRLEEVMEIADRIAVMRDGELIKILPKQEATMEEIIQLMVGRDLDNIFPVRENPFNYEDSEVLMKVNRISGGDMLKDIHFVVRPGEILGIAGLEGSGRMEMVEALLGVRKADCDVEFCGDKYIPKSPQKTYELGIYYTPPERRVEGLITSRSVKENIALSCLKELRNRGVVSSKKIDSLANQYVDKLKIKLNSIEQPILDLSGGNQQKVVISRALATNPKLLILSEPTRGIDVGAKFEIYKLMQELANQGLAIILISSEISEILGMSERIIAFWEGEISGEFESFDNDPNIKEKVLNAIMGGKANLSVTASKPS